MARNTGGLRRGGPGRPKGVPNVATRALKEFWTEFFDSAEYRATAKRRILAGRAPQLEAYLLARVYGRPVPAVDATSPATVVTYRWLDDRDT